MDQVFKNLQAQFDEAATALEKALGGLRAGRATPALVEDIAVEAYGAKMPLKQVAAITVPDHKTLVIEPWDQGLIPAVERAISQAEGLGLAPTTRGKAIFVTIPSLSEERRKTLLKVVGEKFEEARIRLRRDREEAWSEIQGREKDGSIGEDDKFRAKDRLQELVNQTNEKLEQIKDKKEKEMMEI